MFGRFIKYIILLIPFYGLLGQTVHSAGAFGFGDIRAIHSDGIFLSPVATFNRPTLQAEFTYHFVGFSNTPITSGAIGFGHRLSPAISGSAGIRYLHSDIYSRNALDIALSTSLMENARLGFRTKLEMSGFDRSGFDTGLHDPLFDESLRRYAFALDIGASYQLHRFINLGFFAEDIIAPKFHIGEDEEEPPSILRLAVGFDISDDTRFAVEGSYYSEYIDDSRFSFSGGLESYHYGGKAGWRVGLSNDFITAGFSLKDILAQNLRFDYALGYPLSKVVIAGGTTHKIALEYQIPRRQIEKPEEVKLEEPVELSIKAESTKHEELLLRYEEAPFVSAIFFDEDSAIVGDRFLPAIEFIKERLRRNKDCYLEILGYHDDMSDSQTDELAIQRAEAVRHLLDDETISGRVVVIRTGYDKSTPRAGRGQLTDDSLQQEMINQENRRVEFRIRIEDEPLIEAEPRPEFLRRNPDIEIAQFVNIEETPYSDIRESKMMVVPSEIDTVVIIPSSVLYRPQSFEQVLSGQSEIEPAIIIVEGAGEIAFSSWQIDIFDNDGNHISNLGSGAKSTIPETTLFNWRDKDGGLIAVNQDYQVRLHAICKNLIGYEATTLLSLDYQREIQRQRLMPLIIFEYDQAEALESYLQMRLFMLAEEIVRLSKDNRVSVEIKGHSDIIGSHARNIELSQQRAAAQYEKLKQIICYILDIEDIEEWTNGRLSYKGYGDSQPFTSTIGITGDNNQPEGRIINRRVEIEILTE